MRGVFIITLIGGLGLMALSIVPGTVELLMDFPICFVSWPTMGLWLVVLLFLSEIELVVWYSKSEKCLWWAVRSMGITLLTVGLVWFQVPTRIVFLCCYSQFRDYVDNAPDTYRGEQLGRIGLYDVDRYAADKRGGVFFRTNTGPDGIGPDQMSYGFAFRPNGTGSAFGNTRYRQRHLFGDWYTFSASDD